MSKPDSVQNHRAGIFENVHLFKALGDETRLKMIGLLKHGELCVCDFMEVLDLPQSTASRHLAYLRNSGWVVGRRSGTWMYYRLNPRLQQNPVHQAIIAYIGDLGDLQQVHGRLLGYLERKDRKECS